MRTYADHPTGIEFPNSGISVSSLKSLRNGNSKKTTFPMPSRRAGSCRASRGKVWETCFSKSFCFPGLFCQTCFPRFLYFSIDAFACAILECLPLHLFNPLWRGLRSAEVFSSLSLGAAYNRRCVTPVAKAMVRESAENCRADLRSRKRLARRVSTLCQPSGQEMLVFQRFCERKFTFVTALFSKKISRKATRRSKPVDAQAKKSELQAAPAMERKWKIFPLAGSGRIGPRYRCVTTAHLPSLVMPSRKSSHDERSNNCWISRTR
jgi:hypothetical protein